MLQLILALTPEPTTSHRAGSETKGGVAIGFGTWARVSAHVMKK